MRYIYLYISRTHCFFSDALSVSVVEFNASSLVLVRTIGQGRGRAEEVVPAEVTEFMAWKPSTQAGRKGERERTNAREASESLLKFSTKRTPMTSRAKRGRVPSVRCGLAVRCFNACANLAIGTGAILYASALNVTELGATRTNR